jgi:preprotein translocase subunit SecG
VIVNLISFLKTKSEDNMFAFLMTFFVILCIFLAIFILIQQGKGDLGLGSMAGGQMLFGGSGGQNFFERATWIMGAIFIFGALGLTILKSKEQRASILEGMHVQQKTALPAPTNAKNAATKAASDQDIEEADTMSPAATPVSETNA